MMSNCAYLYSNPVFNDDTECFYIPEICNNCVSENVVPTNDIIFSRHINVIRNRLLDNVLRNSKSNKSEEDRNISIDKV